MDFAPKIVKKQEKNTKKLRRNRSRRKSMYGGGDMSERNSEYGGGISDDGQSVVSGVNFANILNQDLNI